MSTKQASHSQEKGKALPDWQKERVEMATLVSEHILDPIMSFAELVRGYDEKTGIGFEHEEITAVLRLLVLGGHAELKTYCVTGGHWCHISGTSLNKEWKEWLEAAATLEEVTK